MTNILKYISAAAILALSVSAEADTIDFETAAGYTGISVYDCWEDSPFRKGLLTGNAALTANPDKNTDEITGLIPNGSDKVVGAQRSRFGSNTFGVRIDLDESARFELTPAVKYVHVKIHRPVTGRVMLVGLGSRNDVPGQNPHTEQFWETSRNTIEANAWYDAVFAVKGAGGITVRSLVIVPECESPHNRTEDFLFYVDDIEINDVPTPAIRHGYYPTSFDKTTGTISRTDRHSTSISLRGSSYGIDQTAAINQLESRKIYIDVTAGSVFHAKPGDTVTPAIEFVGGDMHGYAYIDYNQNGKFDLPDELVAYSNLAGKDSNGNTGTNTPVMPSFTLPADLPAGMYRMRFKIDLNCADPAGNDAPGNAIAQNGGVVADIMLNIVPADGNAVVNDFQLNGEILTADNRKLNALVIPALTPFSILMNPENGFSHNGFRIIYGYNINSEHRFDMYGNPNWYEAVYPAANFDKDNDTFEIPAKHIFGTVRIEGDMRQSTSL